MTRSKTLQGLFVSVLFWVVLVLSVLITSAPNSISSVDKDGKQGHRIFMTSHTAMDSAPTSSPDSQTALTNTGQVSISTDAHHSINGKIKAGEGLDDSFKRLAVPAAARAELIEALSQVLDLKRLQPNDHFSVALDEDNNVVGATYEAGPLYLCKVNKTEQGFIAERLAVPLEVRTVSVSGDVRSSLFLAFTELGEGPKLIYAFANIFSSKIDFNTETKEGDRFQLVFEKIFKDNTFVGYGKILVAKYLQADQELDGYYFSSSNTPAGHYDQNGQELGASFIRSPIPFGRVTSKFSHRRKHPILKVVRPHLGVDLAAPTGTPIMAASDGRVIFAGRKGGFGNTVVIKHAGGYKTYYGHLSKFKKGLKAGSRVKQKDIIGYVGSTGLSTGPHLDYRISENDVFKNPFSIRFKPRYSLKDDELALFKHEKDLLVNLMGLENSQEILQVKRILFRTDKDIFFL